MGDKTNELTELADGIELSDEMLEGITGGYVYHDPGDAAAHRREAFYVVDDDGEILMRTDDMAKAKHWAGNLRESTQVLSANDFNRLRKRV